MRDAEVVVGGSPRPKDLERLLEIDRDRHRPPPFDHASPALESAHDAVECGKVRRRLGMPPAQLQGGDVPCTNRDAEGARLGSPAHGLKSQLHGAGDVTT